MRSVLVAVAALMISAAASADLVTIDVSLDSPGEAGGMYQLVGQSAFVQVRTASSSSGGLLDGVTTGGTSISFEEGFPPPTLDDYLSFAYFGLIETYDASDVLLDTSLVMAFQPGSGVTLITDVFPTYTEAELVLAMSSSFDSTEFFSILDNIGSQASTIGVIAVPPIPRAGETLDLLAFTGGVGGDESFTVGTISMTVVPEPGTLALVLFPALAMLRRRRRTMA